MRYYSAMSFTLLMGALLLAALNVSYFHSLLVIGMIWGMVAGQLVILAFQLWDLFHNR